MADETTTADEIARRQFLTIALGGAATLWVGCGDDGSNAAADTEGSSGTDPPQPGSESTATSAPDDLDTTARGDAEDSDGGDTTDGDTDGEPRVCEPTGRTIAFDPEAIAEDATMFPLAVMAGEMQPTSVMLAVWIPDAEPKLLRVWMPGRARGEVVLVHEAEVQPNADGFVKLTVDGLCPGTWYRYGFFAGPAEQLTARSHLGEVRTAIAEDALEPITFAIASCNGTGGGSYSWPALDVMTDEYYDAFVHMGDMAYNDGSSSLEEYRSRWRNWLGSAGYKNAYARAGLYATWDDHEIDDNSNFDRETMDPAQLQKRQNAMDAYFEALPIDARGPDYRLWRSFRWGLTLELIVLDCRYERRPSQGTYISGEQMAFLQLSLQQSPCHFKVVMNSVPITNMPGLWDIAANDRWEGYPASRDALLGFIDEHDIRNVWFLSGDFHVCFVSRLEPSGENRSAKIREIAVTTGNTNPLGSALPGPQFAFGSSQPHGLIVTFDPEADAVHVRFIDPATGADVYSESLVDE